MIKEAIFIMLTALVLSVCAWVFAPPEKAAPAIMPHMVQEIDQGTLKLILASDPHLLLDARSTESYQAGHLPGAINLPAYEFDDFYPLIRSQFTPNLTIIVYCSSASCQDADLLAEKLQGQQITNILLYRNGFAEWQETGNTIVTGEQP